MIRLDASALLIGLPLITTEAEDARSRGLASLSRQIILAARDAVQRTKAILDDPAAEHPFKVMQTRNLENLLFEICLLKRMNSRMMTS